MEKELKFYEKKILNDKEFPIQLHINRVHEKRWYFSPHWHEHIELHYVVSGRTKFLWISRKFREKKEIWS